MLKFLAFVLLITLLVFAWFLMRQRLKRAFKIGAALYAVLMLVRLGLTVSMKGIDVDELLTLALVTVGFTAIWLSLMLVSGVMAKRRHPKPPSAIRSTIEHRR